MVLRSCCDVPQKNICWLIHKDPRNSAHVIASTIDHFLGNKVGSLLVKPTSNK